MIPKLFSIIFSVMFMTSNFGMMVYILSTLNEHILISSSTSMDCKSVARYSYIEFWMLYAFGSAGDCATSLLSISLCHIWAHSSS
jgi:hypothetical protein